MKHIDLLNLLCKNKELINEAYLQGYSTIANEELIRAGLFLKTSKGYKLNKSYIDFTDLLLQRVDYSIIFSDYEKEYKELLYAKKRYIQTKQPYFKQKILHLIEDIYLKFINRDNEIKAMLTKMEHEQTLELDILIDEAVRVLQKIKEIVRANERIQKGFSKELFGIDNEIDEILDFANVEIFRCIQNIDGYIDWLNRFIVQTKRKRRQNRALMQLSNQILQEKDLHFINYLNQKHTSLLFTIKPQRIKPYPSYLDTKKVANRLKKAIKTLKIEPKQKAVQIERVKKEPLKAIDLERLLADLHTHKPKDLYSFLLAHPEFNIFEEKHKEAFKIFLYLLNYKNIKIKDGFNQERVRIVEWS